MARARIIGTGSARPLDGEWSLTALAPGRAQTPADLEGVAHEWIPCAGPMPAAAALRASGRRDSAGTRDFDAEEWWYRCRFAAGPSEESARLRFEGLATVADAWLNGVHILHSESMFVATAAEVGALLRRDNELVLRFHALGELLSARRPRPKWRTRMVSHQQLRWHRTTLLGRMPSWCPAVAPVGPWRPVVLESGGPLRVDEADVRTHLVRGDGLVRVSVPTTLVESNARARGTLSVGEWTAPATLERSPDGEIVLCGSLLVPQPQRWWPHTHGGQALHQVIVSIELDGDTIAVDLGRVGFRSLDVDRGADGEGFGLTVNGVRVFCRGVCWTPLDLARLDASPADYRAALEQLRDAGMNMLRISGTMVYETDLFHDLCDELGILVWQDFMFANMDYPSGDGSFECQVTREARQLLHRMQGRPSVTVLCGSSELEQQAAMLGLPAERSRHPLFDEVLPSLVSSFLPDVAWLPSTPTGGLFPFHTDRGVTHYYGVGAYRRPFDDVRRAGVRFASECLAFSNVPDATMVDRLLDEGAVPGHHPRWKAGVPRDAAAGWDFEDVRDHYVHTLFGVDPATVRAHDVDRYLELGRIATGEAMLRTFAEWRRPGSSCRGGLVWFARDLIAGAGWGIIDTAGHPKAAYWYLKRACASRALFAVDEGLNGLWLHAVNDTCTPLEAELRVVLYREGRACGVSRTAHLTIPERSGRSLHADGLFDGFLDLTYAYRFGPPQHDAVVATLRDRASGAVIGSAHCFPCGLPVARDSALGLVASAEPIACGYALTLQTERFAHAVAVEADGFVPDDNYVHIEPGEPRRLILRTQLPGRSFRGSVSALNGSGSVPIVAVASLTA